MNLLDKIRIKLAGEDVRANPTSSPDQAIKALEHLPDQEKMKVLDYIQSVQEIKQNEPTTRQ